MRLKPGDILSEQTLAASTGIGRTPIREALQRLALEGLVTILPRKGILVSDINPRKQLLVLEVRREIERLLSRAGAERATKEQRARCARLPRGSIKPPSQRRHRVHAARPRAQRLMLEAGAQRLCGARDEVVAGVVAPLLVRALSRGGRSAALRAAARRAGARHRARARAMRRRAPATS